MHSVCLEGCVGGRGEAHLPQCRVVTSYAWVRGRVKAKIFVFAFSRKFIFRFSRTFVNEIDGNYENFWKIFADIEYTKTDGPFHALYTTAADSILSSSQILTSNFII
jgi:hypothetical protein